MSNILILTEIGEKIGFGHFSRCSSIAQELGKEYKVLVLLNQKGNSDYQIRSSNYKVKFFDWLNEDISFLKKDDFVIIDSYLAEQKHFNSLKKEGIKTLVLDDYYRLSYPTDYIINPNVSADSSMYYSTSAKIFCGAEYVILREEFRGISNVKQKENINEIVITVGGSDYRNLLPRFINKVIPLFPKFQFNILAASEDYKTYLDSLNKNRNTEIFGFLHAEEIKNLFVKSDIAVSASGQTLGELVITSTPFVAFAVDDDQYPTQQFYLAQNIISEKILWSDSDFIEKIEIGIRNLLNKNEREIQIKKARKFIDGKGVERIVSNIKKVLL